MLNWLPWLPPPPLRATNPSTHRLTHLSAFAFSLLQNDEGSSQIRIRVIAGKSLAKKDIFGASDPYVRIDLNTINGDVNIDSVLTKTKKKVSS